jgi:hypothetical protein
MIDLIGILTNLRASLAPIQMMLTGFAYVFGISLVLASLSKLHKIAGAGHQSPSQEKMFVPLTYMAIGTGLIFIPSSISVLSNTLFGSANVLAYSSNNDATVMSLMTFLIQTAGVLWFIRGSILLVHASEPGVKEGSKGLTFIFAGILAMNFETTFEMLNTTFTYLFEVIKTLKNNITDW